MSNKDMNSRAARAARVAGDYSAFLARAEEDLRKDLRFVPVADATRAARLTGRYAVFLREAGRFLASDPRYTATLSEAEAAAEASDASAYFAREAASRGNVRKAVSHAGKAIAAAHPRFR